MIRTLAVSVVIVAAATACGGGGSAAGGDVPPVLGGVCAARDAAAAGDASVAATTFTDRVHQPLHDLAARTTPVDRAIAARLLEAKQVVEADLAADPVVAEVLGDDLGTLATVTAEALAALDEPGRQRCP